MSDVRRVKFVLLAALLTAACTMPATKIYSLYFPAQEKVPVRAPGVALTLNVDSVRYLGQPYIAYRNSPYQLELSGYAKWDAAPAEMVRDAFGRYLEASGIFAEVRAARVPLEGAYSLEIYLNRFERLDAEGGSYGTLAFEARLFSPGGKQLYKAEIDRKFRLQDRSFLSLARALSSGLLEAMEEVKGQVAKAMAAGDSGESP